MSSDFDKILDMQERIDHQSILINQMAQAISNLLVTKKRNFIHHKNNDLFVDLKDALDAARVWHLNELKRTSKVPKYFNNVIVMIDGSDL